jgi:hypothetical protein
MNPPNAHALPQPQMTFEAFVNATVHDASGVRQVSTVILRGRVDADGSWVLAFHDAGEPLRCDALAGDEPEVAQMLLNFWRKVAAVT